MELQQFVSQALIELTKGIAEAGKQLESAGTIINPRHVNVSTKERAEVYGWVSGSESKLRAVHLVEFDIAVTATEGTEKQGGIGVVAGAIALGGRGRTEESSATVSRIRFKVPVALPTTPADA